MHLCMYTSVWMMEDLLQNLGLEEQNQAAGIFSFTFFIVRQLKTHHKSTNTIKKTFLKFRQIKPNEKRLKKTLKKMNKYSWKCSKAQMFSLVTTGGKY